MEDMARQAQHDQDAEREAPEEEREDDDFDRPSNTEVCYNVSGETVKFEIDGARYRLRPNERVTLNIAYTRPSQMQKGRDPVPSQVELLTNKRVLPMSHRKFPKHLKDQHESEMKTS